MENLWQLLEHEETDELQSKAAALSGGQECRDSNTYPPPVKRRSGFKSFAIGLLFGLLLLGGSGAAFWFHPDRDRYLKDGLTWLRGDSTLVAEGAGDPAHNSGLGSTDLGSDPGRDPRTDSGNDPGKQPGEDLGDGSGTPGLSVDGSSSNDCPPPDVEDFPARFT